MPKNTSKQVQPSKVSKTDTLSKSQKQFNRLNKKLDESKKLLARWQEAIPAYYREYQDKYEPLLRQWDESRADLVRLFDSVYDDKAFKKRDKDKLKFLIVEMSPPLIDNGIDDLEALYEKYSGTSFEEDSQETDKMVGSAFKQFVEMAFNTKIEEDITSPEQLENLMREKLKEQEEQHRQTEERRANRKKTPKQLEKEEKMRQEEQSVSQSIREAYRKLSSSLHPDREQDPEERERKTEMMQRVNAAYSKKDLLKLLELQLEVEQIDPSFINNLAEDRLKYINTLLSEQIREVEAEISHLTLPLQGHMNSSPYLFIHPNNLIGNLNFNIQRLKYDIEQVAQDIADFQDVAVLKAWLKDYKIPKMPDVEGELDMLMDMMGFVSSRMTR